MVPGVRGIDHTADVGLVIEAPDLPELFRRAALGMLEVVYDQVPFAHGLPSRAVGERTLSLSSRDLPSLLRDWLREVLRWCEAEGFVPGECTARVSAGTRLEATVRGAQAPFEPVREIKGVTLHGLQVERTEEGWRGRVVFDV